MDLLEATILQNRPYSEWLEDCRFLIENRRLKECLDKFTTLVDSVKYENTQNESSSLRNKLLAEWLYERGRVLYLMVEFREAVNDFTEALQYNPNLVLAMHDRALIHYRLGRFEEAKHDLEKCLELDKTFDEARSCLAVVESAHAQGRNT